LGPSMQLRSWFSTAAQPTALKPAEAQHAIILERENVSCGFFFLSFLSLPDFGRRGKGEKTKTGEHTEDARHDGDAWILLFALGIVHA
jgi:hypothetical protein